MTKPAVVTAVEAVLELPEADQIEAVGILNSLIDQRDSGLRLSAAQVEEVRRILADPNPQYATEEEMEAFFQSVRDGR